MTLCPVATVGIKRTCRKGLLYACTLSSYGMFVQKPRMKVETSILGVSSYNEEKIKNR